MNTFRFPTEVRSVVCLGAHPDDIEIGAAGTIIGLASAYPEATFHFIIVTGSVLRQEEARASASRLLDDRVTVTVGGFADAFVPYEDPAGAKRFISSAGRSASPDLVLAPQRDDLHQDHRFVGEVAGQIWRDCMILGYEIAKYDGGLAAPNLYMPLDRATVEYKVEHIMDAFPSQRTQAWFTEDAFRSLMRLRGIESKSPSGFAEAFVCSKMVLS